MCFSTVLFLCFCSLADFSVFACLWFLMDISCVVTHIVLLTANHQIRKKCDDVFFFFCFLTRDVYKLLVSVRCVVFSPPVLMWRRCTRLFHLLQEFYLTYSCHSKLSNFYTFFFLFFFFWSVRFWLREADELQSTGGKNRWCLERFKQFLTLIEN